MKPRNCRTCRLWSCRWYDPMGDLRRNPAGPHEWENMDRRMTCKRWVAEK